MLIFKESGYPWTQAVPDDPTALPPIPPNDAQNTPQNTLQILLI